MIVTQQEATDAAVCLHPAFPDVTYLSASSTTRFARGVANLPCGYKAFSISLRGFCASPGGAVSLRLNHVLITTRSKRTLIEPLSKR